MRLKKIFFLTFFGSLAAVVLSFLFYAFFFQSVPYIFTHGISVGDISSERAVIWARTNQDGVMHLNLKSGKKSIGKYTNVTEENDFIGKIHVTDLLPNTSYNFSIWFSSSNKTEQLNVINENSISGQFKTFPSEKEKSKVKFAFSGDISGQNICRDKQEGLPIFNVISSKEPDFFIGLGDLIYADAPCGSIGAYKNEQVETIRMKSWKVEHFWEYWKYNREDPSFQKFLSRVPFYAVWDDHEVRNDFGPFNDISFPDYPEKIHLMPHGLKAFLDYNPIQFNKNDNNRIYRKFRYGKNVEFFILDTRQYRDKNSQKDNPNQPKTMLGREQVDWLKRSLKNSDAVWKIIISSVPMSVPTGIFPKEFGRDGWANYDTETGYEIELLEILNFIRKIKIKKSIWLSSDAHFAEVFQYKPFKNAPEFIVYEVVTGPLNAGLFPNIEFDSTLNPKRLFYWSPKEKSSVKSFTDAKIWFNFGLITISSDGVLILEIINAQGKLLYSLNLDPN
jgi:alkaline phosphatase D